MKQSNTLRQKLENHTLYAVTDKQVMMCRMQANLVEVRERLVQVSMHASRRLVGDFDRRFQYSLRYDVRLSCRRRFRTDKHSEILVAFDGCLLQFLLQRVQPTCHQMYILQ